MNRLDFLKLNLRDLGMLVSLVEHKKIAPVAAKYGVSPSGVSYALDRLRTALADELLIRTRNGFRPTKEAKQFASQAKSFLDSMQDIGEPPDFDPSRSDRDFVIAATEYELSGFLGPVLTGLLSTGKNLGVRIIQTNQSLSPDRLNDDIDCALLPIELSLSGLIQERLSDDPYCVFFDPAHPFSGTLDDFCSARHAVMSPDGRAHTNVDRSLARVGRRRQIGLVAPNFQSMANIMRGTDQIATLPSALAKNTFQGFDCVAPPLDLGTMPLFLTFARSKASDTGLNWFLDRIRTAAMRHPASVLFHRA